VSKDTAVRRLGDLVLREFAVKDTSGRSHVWRPQTAANEEIAASPHNQGTAEVAEVQRPRMVEPKDRRIVRIPLCGAACGDRIELRPAGLGRVTWIYLASTARWPVGSVTPTNSWISVVNALIASDKVMAGIEASGGVSSSIGSSSRKWRYSASYW
jgi:hypothetical protein